MASEFYRTSAGWVLKLTPPLPEAMRNQVTRGDLTRVANADGGPYIAEAEPIEPAKAAPKAEWVGWARHVDPDLSADDADAMTKNDLIEKYGTR